MSSKTDQNGASYDGGKEMPSGRQTRNQIGSVGSETRNGSGNVHFIGELFSPSEREHKASAASHESRFNLQTQNQKVPSMQQRYCIQGVPLYLYPYRDQNEHL